MNDLHISWDRYHELIEELAAQVAASAWEFDTIMCIARGGLRIGDVFSRVFRKPLAILTTSSYRAGGGTEQSNLLIALNYSAIDTDLGARVLLIDDMADSGHTLECVVEQLKKQHPRLSELRTAVLWHKAHSTFKPTYAAQYLETNPWIHQPFELYDRLPIEVILQRTA